MFHRDRRDIESALGLTKSVADKINDTKRKVEQMLKVVEIQNRFVESNFVSIVEPHRVWVKEGLLKFSVDKGKPRETYCFLVRTHQLVR